MNGNYGLVYPALDDYYDVNVTNENFSKLADGIDEIKSGGIKKEVVVAAHNSQNKYKEAADFTCGEDDCTDIVAAAISKCCEGGDVLFLDGDYYFTKTADISKSVRIMGYGPATRFNIKSGFTGYAVLKISADNVCIREISFADDVNDVKNAHFINLCCKNAVISCCDFTMNATHSNDNIAALFSESYSCRVLVMGCYMIRHNDSCWFMYGDETDFAGVVMGNYCECIDDKSDLQIKIMTSDLASAAKIKTAAQNTYIFAKTGGVYNG